MEGLVGCFYVERPENFDRYRNVFELLYGMALTPQESIDLIRRTSAPYLGAVFHPFLAGVSAPDEAGRFREGR